jgi:predicted ATPase
VRAGEQPVEAGSAHPWPLLERAAAAPLRALTIGRYRGLTGVALPELKRVNLLVGVNNAGKTSILEAIYLLSRLSDPRGLLDTLRVRTRQDPERDPSLLSTLLAGLEVEVQAVDAGERPLSVKLSRLLVVEGADLATQLPGMRLEATVDDVVHATTTELFSHRPRRTVQATGASAWLAPAVLHSPYARMDRAELMRCYERSVEEGALGTILAAVREAVDPGIEDLRLVSEGGRFVVQHRHRGPMDISSYGEGLQRVFEIGLLFAAHRGGLVLIDELETAIHPSAMIRFTKLVHELAVRFDVQVFITTHSKETVDSFLFNDYEVSEVAAYVLKQRPEGGVEVRRFAGPQLRRAVEVGDVDLRWL